MGSKEGIVMKLRGLKSAFIFLSGLILLSACGEERENKPLPKVEVMSKSLIDTEKEYLYVPSTDQVSRNTRIGRPFFQGDEKIVKFQFEKDYLVAYAQEKDIRFGDNQTNNKPVFRIPITHLEYREAKDPFGEGTNVEEENKFVPWNKRKYFEPKPQSFEFTDVSTLPTELDHIFGDSCSRKVGQSDLSFEVTQDRIDIVIKRDFNSNYFCTDITELSDLGWSEVTQYSIVPLEKLVSTDYETIVYDRDWERTFGFFDTLDVKVDSSNNQTQKQEVYYMNRWNPKRETITYHLDPRFEKPENKNLKLATLLGIQRLNDALATAGVNFRINAVDGATTLRPGDLTVSSIVLVEDPLAVGLLGYGPSVKNPRTGEIVQARTVMYPGVMKQFIRRAYDTLYDEAQLAAQGSKRVPRAKLSPANANIMSALDNGMAPKILAHQGGHWSHHHGELAALNDLAQAPVVLNPEQQSSNPDVNSPLHLTPINKLKNLIQLGAKGLFKDTSFSLRAIFNGFKEQNQDFDLDHLDVIEVLSKHNMTPARVEAFVDIQDGKLKDRILALGQNKEWHELDEDTRSQIIDIVMPYVWIPTLIHEVGHNLGLRHNFAGSEDKDNFYSKEELKRLGVDSEFGSPYASMMEYTKSEITGLRVPGKYDIAALRYGYLQKVELQDGSIVPVTAKPTELTTLKTFEYCSDEGVALNPNCNRFDEGVGYVEIANSIIDSYNEMYKLRNFRSGRANFSMMDDIIYASGINQQFRTLRLMLERLTDIMLDFDVPLSEIKNIDWLNDLNEASKLSAEFLKSVVAEADYSCVIFSNGQFHSVVKFAELGGFSTAKKCTDVELNPQFTVVGELGRRYNHEKFRDNPNIYLDQIDVRGVWMDKLLALRYLVARNLNEYSFDDYTISYLDHPEIGNDVNKFLKDLLVGNVISKTEVTLNDGTKTDFEYAHNFSNGYQIKKPLTSYFHRFLNLPQDQLDLSEAIAHIANKQLGQGLDSISNQTMRESLELYKEIPRDGRDPASFEIYRLGRVNYVASPENEVGLEIINKLKKIDLYESQTREKLIDILTAIDNNQPLPANATAEEQQIYAGGIDDLFLFLVGELPTKEYYSRVLISLAI